MLKFSVTPDAMNTLYAEITPQVSHAAWSTVYVERLLTPMSPHKKAKHGRESFFLSSNDDQMCRKEKCDIKKVENSAICGPWGRWDPCLSSIRCAVRYPYNIQGILVVKDVESSTDVCGFIIPSTTSKSLASPRRSLDWWNDHSWLSWSRLAWPSQAPWQWHQVSNRSWHWW